MNWKHIFLVVTGCALAGMFMGGAFGFTAGNLAPNFFRHTIPWQDIEPVGFATFLGATVGVILGGGLGCFAIIIQFFSQRKRQDHSALATPSSEIRL